MLGLRRLMNRDERGVSLTTEVLIFIPAAFIFLGFLVNGAMHWIGMQYVQNATNNASKYTAAALGNNPLPFIPDGGYNVTPAEYLATKVSAFPLTAGQPPEVNCVMVSGLVVANGIARCTVAYKTVIIPTDPLSLRIFGQRIVAVAESLNETGTNPNVQ